MKCIKYKVGNRIVRVNDETAHSEVKKGIADYCPKNEWKGVAVKVNKDGKILDGHTRMMVAQELDVPVKTEVIA